jgi:hypothetical protein
LNTAYTQAQNQYNQNLQNQLAGYGLMGQSASTLGQLGQSQYQQQMGINALQNQYGGQQQAQGQKLLDYPMAQTQAFAKLMQGYQIPTGEVKQSVGPVPGAYSNSPLSQIATLLSGLGSFLNTPTPKQAEGGPITKADGGYIEPSNPPDGAAYHDGRGNFYDATGTLVE